MQIFRKLESTLVSLLILQFMVAPVYAGTTNESASVASDKYLDSTLLIGSIKRQLSNNKNQMTQKKMHNGLMRLGYKKKAVNEWLQKHPTKFKYTFSYDKDSLLIAKFVVANKSHTLRLSRSLLKNKLPNTYLDGIKISDKNGKVSVKDIINKISHNQTKKKDFTVINKIISSFIPSAIAIAIIDDALLGIGIGIIVIGVYFVMIPAVSTLEQNLWLQHIVLSQNFCCIISKRAKNRYTELKNTTNKCISQLTSVLSGEVKSRKDALEKYDIFNGLHTGIIDSEDEDFIQSMYATYSDEDIQANLVNFNKKLVNVCRSEQEKVAAGKGIFVEFSGWDFEQVNSPKCVAEYAKAKPFFNGIVKYAEIRKSCLNVVKKETFDTDYDEYISDSGNRWDLKDIVQSQQEAEGKTKRRSRPFAIDNLF